MANNVLMSNAGTRSLYDLDQKAQVAIVSGGALVTQSNVVIVPIEATINPGGGGDAGRAVVYLTDDGTNTGADLFSSIIGRPTISIIGTGGSPATAIYIANVESVTAAHRCDVFACDIDGAAAPDNTPFTLWVTGIPA